MEKHKYQPGPALALCRELPTEQPNQPLTSACFIALWKLESLLQLHKDSPALALMRCHAPEQGLCFTHGWNRLTVFFFWLEVILKYQNLQGRIRISDNAGCAQSSPIPFRTLGCSRTFERLYSLNTKDKLLALILLVGKADFAINQVHPSSPSLCPLSLHRRG